MQLQASFWELSSVARHIHPDLFGGYNLNKVPLLSRYRPLDHHDALLWEELEHLHTSSPELPGQQPRMPSGTQAAQPYLKLTDLSPLVT